MESRGAGSPAAHQSAIAEDDRTAWFDYLTSANNGLAKHESYWVERLIRVGVARDPRQAVPLQGSYRGEVSDFIDMTVEVKVTAAG